MYRFQISRLRKNKCLSSKDNMLVICTIVSVFLGVIVALPFIIVDKKLNEKQIYFISLPGVVFMNLMKMMILPLLVLSLISGLTSLNLSTGRKQALYSIIYFILTTFLAVFTGMALAKVIPARNVTYIANREGERKSDPAGAIATLFNNLFPDNIIHSTFQKFELQFENVSYKSGRVSQNKTFNINIKYTNGTNYLGIIFISIFFGIVLNCLGSRGQIIVTLITVLNDLTMKMVKVILWYMPVGTFFLILSTLLKADFSSNFWNLYSFILTVVLGLMVHSLVVLPLIYAIIVRQNPFTIIKKMFKALIVAFVTQSSSATMPVTMNCVDENLKIDKRVTRFIVPVGAIVNMNGTALFQAVSAIFISKISDQPLDVGTYFIVFVTSTLASIGAATLPSAGLVTLIMVLSAADLKLDYVTLLYTCDWLLDRFRTAVNILGDAFGCGIIQTLCKEELEDDININDHFTTNL